jgi:2-(3-amino-3-carboxypropyl)histidine synthase
VPVTTTRVPALYVFVEISLPHAPLLTVMKQNFMGRRVALLATVQYVSLLHAIKTGLTEMDLYIPQIRPLSPGEVLGCTAPRLPAGTDALMFVADGRFHLEAAMIANPTIPAYRYDPFTKRVFEEKYDHALMLDTRRHAIETARPAQHFGVILGTLGRQGSPAVLADIIAKLHAAGKQTTVVLMSEVRPEQLAQFSTVQAWIQTSCPRLSIDWGYTFEVPLLTPYELNVMLQKTESFGMGSYRMDFYATGDMGSGPWTPGHHLRPPRKTNKPI